MIRVMVVDDEPETLEMLSIMLELKQMEPITTTDPTTALDLAIAEMPDVVLLDIMMPEMDGFELCEVMRAHDEVKDRPIAFVTAYSGTDLNERADAVGADMVLIKPLDIKTIDETIANLQAIRATV